MYKQSKFLIQAKQTKKTEVKYIDTFKLNVFDQFCGKLCICAKICRILLILCEFLWFVKNWSDWFDEISGKIEKWALWLIDKQLELLL